MNTILDIMVNAAIVLLFIYGITMIWIYIKACIAKFKRTKRRWL